MRILEMEDDEGKPIVELSNLRRVLKSNHVTGAMIGFAMGFMVVVMILSG